MTRLLVREIPVALAAAALTSLALAGEWRFIPSGGTAVSYNSNVERASAGSPSDLVWSSGVNLAGSYTSDRDRLDLSYRPIYRYYVEHNELSQLDHVTRIAWDHSGNRNSGGITATFSQTDDPRQVTEPGSTTTGGQAPFVTKRTRTTSAGADVSHEYRLWPSTSLRTSAYYRATSYEDPTLSDNENGGLSFGAAHRTSARTSWTWGLDHQDFRAEGFEPRRLTSARGGFSTNPVRPLSFDAVLNLILTGQGGFEDLTGANRLYGLATVTGTHDWFQWSFGLSRSFDSGSGLTDVSRTDQIKASAGWNLGRSDVLALSIGRAISKGPSDTGTPLDLATDTGSLSLDHRFTERWAMRFAVDRTRQEGTAPSDGIFNQDTVTIGVIYGAGGGV